MRSTLLILGIFGAGCGGNDPAVADGQVQPDTEASSCSPVGTIGSFYRRTVNPRIVAGHQTYSDNMIDIGISDPDLRWDDASQLWNVYFHGPHAASFSSPTITQMVRHAISPDLAAWTIDDAPSLVASSDAAAWDHQNTETPTVAMNPDASADRRYLLLYSGAKQKFPFPNYSFADYSIGAAFSADGKTFTRITAAESPHNQVGLVLTGLDAFPGATGGIVADPKLVYHAGVYHLWFSSFSCMGTTCDTVGAYGISHATSTDGIHWTVQAAPVRSLLRASADLRSGGAQPTVIYDEVHCRWELWMTSDMAGDTDAQPIVFNNAAGVWHGISNDGLVWNVNYFTPRDLAWTKTEDGEHLGMLTGADVAAKGTGRYMLYGGFDDQNVPTGFFLPDRSTQGYEPGVMTLNLATRDAL
ncbi:MAG: hypothetical protein JWO36_7445 [Myxococcales bacterium]|nr:hypothetical protein [Myxococcales bacterium]